VYYEERHHLRRPPEPDQTFRFGLSTEAEFIAGNVLLRVIEESAPGTPRKLIVRIPEDEAHPVMRAAGGALVVQDLVNSGAWEALARPIPAGARIPIADVAALRPYLSKLPYPNL
jgi:hypothetical protein